jgi:DNA anti-recombination protein RmuC
MRTTRQQLTIASFRELWKNEFLPEIRNEIDSANASLYTEIRDLNKSLDEFEKTLSFFSEQYDQLIKITETTKKPVQQIVSKIEDQGKTIIGLKNNNYDNMFAIDEIQQYQRRDCLEITGIPTLPNDKPKNIVTELGATL